MPKFYDHIDLRTNQLKNAVIESAASAPNTLTEVPGQIYYDTGDDAIKLRKSNGASADSWVALADTTTYGALTNGGLDVTTQDYSLDFNNLAHWDAPPANSDRLAIRITDLGDGTSGHRYITFDDLVTNVGAGTIGTVEAGTGLTGGGSSNTVTLNVIGGDGITANANEIEVTVDDTTIELSTSNGSGAVRAKTATVEDNGTALATGDQIHAFVTGYADAAGTDNSTAVTLAGSLDYLTITGQEITRGAIDLTTDVTGTLPVGKGGTGLATTTAKAVVITADAGGTTALETTAMAANGQLLIGGTNGPAVSTLTQGDNITITNSDGGISIAGTANDDVDVSIANLEERLPQIDTATTIGNGVAITAGGDFVVTGDLTVSGTTTTVNSTAVSIEDPVMRLGGHVAQIVGTDGDVGVEFIHNGVRTNGPTMTLVDDAVVVSLADHGYQVGDLATVVNNAVEAMNGTFVVTLVGSNAFGYTIESSPGDITTSVQAGSITVAERSFFGYDNSADVFSGFVDVTNNTDSPSGYTGTLMSAKFNDATLTSLTLGGHAVNDIDITSESSDADDHLMTALAIKNRIDDLTSGFVDTSGTTGVDLTGGTGIAIGSETNTSGGAYSATITCDLEGTELASTGESGTTKFLRTDGDGTCSWQTPSYATPIPDTNLDTKTAKIDVSVMDAASNTVATIAHNLSTLQPIVQLWLTNNSGDLAADPAVDNSTASEQIEAQIDCHDSANVKITFAKLPTKDVYVTIIAPNVSDVTPSYS